MNTNKNNRAFLKELRIAIPFLQKIPDEIYFSLDTAEFLMPDKKIRQARALLEKLLCYNVMIYKKDVFNIEVPFGCHLCANIKEACLNKDQITILSAFEAKYKQYKINFVIYEKPLMFIKPLNSSVWEFYRKQGEKTSGLKVCSGPTNLVGPVVSPFRELLNDKRDLPQVRDVDKHVTTSW